MLRFENLNSEFNAFAERKGLPVRLSTVFNVGQPKTFTVSDFDNVTMHTISRWENLASNRLTHADAFAVALKGTNHVKFLTYLVLLDKNKKHNSHYYMSNLDNLCRRFTELGMISQFTVFTPPSHVNKIRRYSSCLKNANIEHLREFSELWYKEESEKIDSTCHTKFGMNVGNNFLRKLARIWLSKVRVLCDSAKRSPNVLTIMMDAGITSHDKGKLWRNMLNARWKHRDGSIGLQSYHPHKTDKKWFGRDKCTAPIAHAGFLAIKGKDCPNILRAFDEALSIESGKSRCGCYDEESALTRMFQLYPHLFEWQGTWPDYQPTYLLGIGTSKGGTTTLDAILNQHPMYSHGGKKEHNYFDKRGTSVSGWYKQFSGHTAEVYADITPNYMLYPHVVNVVKSIPNLKIVVMLRDPVARMISSGGQQNLWGEKTFDDAVSHALRKYDHFTDYESFSKHVTVKFRKSKEGSLMRGIYSEQLKPWIKSGLPLLIIKSENFYANTSAEIVKVCNFVGLYDCNKLDVDIHLNLKTEKAGRVSIDTRMKLSRFYEPWNQALYKLLPDFIPWITYPVSFLHPTKTGGYSVSKLLSTITKIKNCHPNPCIVDEGTAVITLRDPIHRFVSEYFWMIENVCKKHDTRVKSHAWSHDVKSCQGAPFESEENKLLNAYGSNINQFVLDLCLYKNISTTHLGSRKSGRTKTEFNTNHWFNTPLKSWMEKISNKVKIVVVPLSKQNTIVVDVLRRMGIHVPEHVKITHGTTSKFHRDDLSSKASKCLRQMYVDDYLELKKLTTDVNCMGSQECMQVMRSFQA